MENAILLRNTLESRDLCAGERSFSLFRCQQDRLRPYDLPLYLTFADPMNTPGLMLGLPWRRASNFEVPLAHVKKHSRPDDVTFIFSPGIMPFLLSLFFPVLYIHCSLFSLYGYFGDSTHSFEPGRKNATTTPLRIRSSRQQSSTKQQRLSLQSTRICIRASPPKRCPIKSLHGYLRMLWSPSFVLFV